LKNQFIMTAFGKDRPGIVAEISELIFENKCRLEDSNMGRLADEFTLILLLSGTGDNLQEKLSTECKRLEREKNISAFIRPLEFQRIEEKNGDDLFTIKVDGIDQAGIVYKVSRLLAENRVNIETLRSRKKHLPNTGTAMYSMEITARIPDSISHEDLEKKMETLANDIHLDIRIS